MAAPTGTATLDKATYAPGETMRLTVTYSDPDAKPIKATIVLTDAAGNSSAPVTVTTAITDPVTFTVTDPDRTWSLVSDDGRTAVLTAKA
jgi:hypothetical protein